MSRFLDTLRHHLLLTDGAMGSYLFELTGRLSEANHVYEAFPAERPELIEQIYYTYLQAGAQCLKTDTFGANRTKLVPLGLGERVEQLNRAGVRIARAAATHFQAMHQHHEPIAIIASVGPLRDADLPAAEAAAAFREQLTALHAEGVDAVLFETFTHLPHLLTAIAVTRELAPEVPVIALVSPQPHGSQGGWQIAPQECGPALIAAGAAVIGVNCCPPWEAEAFVRQLAELPEVKAGEVLLSAMPNAGGLQRIDNRYMSSVNPEFMGRQARTFADLGVRLIGGCCEVHPPHIREMHAYLRSRTGAGAITAVVTAPGALPPAGLAEKRGNGPFSRKLCDCQFCVSVEVLPPRGTSAKAFEGKVNFIRELAASGLADAVDITDGSRGIPLMPPGDFVLAARRQLGWPGNASDPLEFIPHFTGRDLNTMGIQSRLTGYYFNEIHNVIYITGDPPKMSPTYPRSTAVFDLDSSGLVHYTHACLNAGMDFGGQALGKQPDPRMHFTIGTGYEPEALNHPREIEKLERKIASGADYLMTQPAFRFEPLETLAPYRDKVKILVGVMVLTNLAHALRVADVPGVTVPREVIERLERYDNPDDQAKAARDFAAEQVAWVKREGWAGLYLMSPASHRPILDVLAAGLG